MSWLDFLGYTLFGQKWKLRSPLGQKCIVLMIFPVFSPVSIKTLPFLRRRNSWFPCFFQVETILKQKKILFYRKIFTITNFSNDFYFVSSLSTQIATTSKRPQTIGYITIHFKYTSKSSGHYNNNWLVCASILFESAFWIEVRCVRWTDTINCIGFNLGFSSVSTAMDNSMGQIVPMTSLALSQSMDSVNTATNEEEVSVFLSIWTRHSSVEGGVFHIVVERLCCKWESSRQAKSCVKHQIITQKEK